MKTLDELSQAPGHLIRRAQQLAVALFMEECVDAGLTPVQLAALVAIRDKGLLDATRLSASIALDRSTIGNVLERLERKGLIERFFHKEDKRLKVLRLTVEGGELLKLAAPSVKRAHARLLSALSPAERRMLTKLLKKLVEGRDYDARARGNEGAA